jgi:hypothetical protein
MPRHLSPELKEAGKRIADQINARVRFTDWDTLKVSWMAFDLNDGSTKGDLYDSLEAAKRFTDEWKTCYYAMMGVIGGVTAHDAAVYLDFCRAARDANLGHRDPSRQAFLSVTGADVMMGRN